MSSFDYFACDLKLLDSVKSQIERDILRDLYCNIEYSLLNYVNFYYNHGGRSFLLVLAVMLIIWFVSLKVIFRLNQQIMVRNLLEIKSRLKLSPLMAVLFIVVPLNQTSILWEDKEQIFSPDYYALQYNFLFWVTIALTGFCVPLLILMGKDNVTMPKYATRICLAFNVAGIFLLGWYAIDGKMRYIYVLLNLGLYGVLIWLSFWAKRKDEDYTRMLLEEQGYYGEPEEEIVAEDDYQTDEFDDADQMLNEFTSREAPQTDQPCAEDNFKNDLESGHADDDNRSNRSLNASEPDNNSKPVHSKSKAKRVKKMLQKEHKVVKELSQNVKTVLEESFNDSWLYVPLDLFLFLAVPFYKNPIMNTHYKYVVIFLGVLTTLVIQFWKTKLWILIVVSKILTLTIGLLDAYVLSPKTMAVVYDVLSFLQIQIIMTLFIAIMDDSFPFLEFYFSLNKAIVSGFFDSIRYGISMLVCAHWLYQNKEREMAILSLYAWPLFGTFVSFAIWSAQGLYYSKSTITFFKETFVKTDFVFNKSAATFAHWLLLFVTILFLVKAFYFTKISLTTDRSMAKSFLAVFCTFMLVFMPFAFS